MNLALHIFKQQMQHPAVHHNFNTANNHVLNMDMNVNMDICMD